jgi:transketolase
MTDMRTEFAETAHDILAHDPLAAVVLADISTSLFEDATVRFPDRLINVGIRESLMISVGGGLALTGMHPMMHSYTPFLIERAFEQIKLDLGHQDAAAVLVSIGASYDVPTAGRTHHGPGDVTLIDTVPGFTVYVPGHASEVPTLLRDSVGQPHSSYIRLSEATNTVRLPVSPGLTVVRNGGRALVIAVGPMLDPVLDATEGMDVTVAYATTVRPFDTAGVRALAATDTVVIVEPYLAGTSIRLIDEALVDRPHRTLGLGVARTELRRYGTVTDHSRAYGLDPAGIRSSLDQFLAVQPVEAGSGAA